ncbi:biotin--[acetyl-CoA-carboxylase] ligase [Pseudorhodoplanes sp.]|uniref:biotin--[acetyl-CoA-carboxylase] ligase n=1 Tax=Pseudorhodoplanes sp. TaxID=1934341 RepID=UPI002C44D70A|nr:biotin--[acetyl-CoA-carboxylase] ligase [Pseudorhodoplanes sp.]HWV54897.1 biotin--[acetyl-CoA-carboxylase] ligase [Pseudorhodoplanes sp.]
MGFELGPRAAEAGHRLVVHESLDSTNSEALRLARSGEGGPLWIVAREQTAGRGRRGREWVSAGGNLATSLLVSLPVTPAVAATLGFVASLAVRDACSAQAQGAVFALKWPNDVLADGAKVAGLLLESEARAGTLAIVIGIGVNVASAPSGMPYPAAFLRSFAPEITAGSVFSQLTDAWMGYAGRWDEGHGFDVIRRAWLAQARGIGQAISVRTGDRVESGIFETLDEEGRLILRKTDGMIRVISAGDVYFGDVSQNGAAS